VTSVAHILAATRRNLESSYGLALDGLNLDQIAAAIGAAAQGGWPEDLADPAWLARVVDRLPIDESWLFRDDDLWSWLRDEAGPALIEKAFALGRPVRIASLGCSAGQEPFSLAILFQGLLEGTGIPGSAASGYVSIVGIDSSPARVELARSGVVNGWSVQRSRADWLRGRVTLEDPQTGRHRMDPTVRGMCRFEVGNLVELACGTPGPLAGYDLVLCRHVLIYFRPSEAERIAAGLARALDPGTLLAFSAAEAHLLAASGTVEPLGQLGVGRAGRPPVPSATRTPPLGTPAPALRRRAARRSAPAPWAPAPFTRPPADAAAHHVRIAVEHARAGRTAEALQEARAALFHDPHQLFPLLLLAEQLMAIDMVRGRQMLRELLDQAARLPRESSVPLADGLSVGQLADAATLLLGSSEAP
jgi:chemotaxis protein methyltransferase CheR